MSRGDSVSTHQSFGGAARLRLFTSSGRRNSPAQYLDAFPEQIHVVRYEDVVADLQAAATPMFEHLGLDWDPGVIDYHEMAREHSIATPSYRQVTRPLYGNATRRWTRYRPQLEPFLERLQPFVDRFGYE